MPPEYMLESILSTKCDVYSFGVTLHETISGMCRSEPARHRNVELAVVRFFLTFRSMKCP
jgi:serine/threonine protein kinase